MQRSLTYQDNIRLLAFVFLYAIYLSLSSIYLLLPPLLAIIFYHFSESLKQRDNYAIFFFSVMLILFETEKGFLLFSSIAFVTLMHYFVMPVIEQNVHCTDCLKVLYTFGAYLGFWLFSAFLNQVFWMPLPDLDWYMLYYILVELLVVFLL